MTDNHEKKICPRCKRVGTIRYWKKAGKQQNLFGATTDVELHATHCGLCGREYPRGYKFDLADEDS